ncbi:hypothetical protein L2E82_51072 [Cichorium intybus]|nr:hypothetical protein L2E82_51072 [Cichorium intybus]
MKKDDGDVVRLYEGVEVMGGKTKLRRYKRLPRDDVDIITVGQRSKEIPLVFLKDLSHNLGLSRKTQNFQAIIPQVFEQIRQVCVF